MPQFFTSDELGIIRLIHCSPTSDLEEWKFEDRVVHAIPAHRSESKSVQNLKLAILSSETLHHAKLAAAKSDGTISAFYMNAGGTLDTIHEWKESRFMPGHKFVGLAASEGSLFWCSSNGALGLSTVSLVYEEPSNPVTRKAHLPTRLCDWRLSPDRDTFTYGGNEVELSVWNVERAFATSNATSPDAVEKKRKRGNDLLPGEIWRAKNVPNDSLSLREPVHITSLAYLHNSTGIQNHIVTATQYGNVRRYDTRIARRPVANWKNLSKFGGINVVEAGLHEHELFIADHGHNLLALDLRNGRTIYAYKKIAGAITSLAPCPGQLMASTSRDRFFRLHSTAPPPEQAGGPLAEKGENVGNIYMKSTPTVAIFDPTTAGLRHAKSAEMEQEHDNDVWNGMQDAVDT